MLLARWRPLAPRPPSPSPPAMDATLGREPGGLDLDAHPELHDAQDLRHRAQTLGIDPERSLQGIERDEGADALTREDQPLGAQRRDRLADHRPADAEGRHHGLLG